MQRAGMRAVRLIDEYDDRIALVEQPERLLLVRTALAAALLAGELGVDLAVLLNHREDQTRPGRASSSLTLATDLPTSTVSPVSAAVSLSWR